MFRRERWGSWGVWRAVVLPCIVGQAGWLAGSPGPRNNSLSCSYSNAPPVGIQKITWPGPWIKFPILILFQRNICWNTEIDTSTGPCNNFISYCSTATPVGILEITHCLVQETIPYTTLIPPRHLEEYRKWRCQVKETISYPAHIPPQHPLKYWKPHVTGSNKQSYPALNPPQYLGSWNNSLSCTYSTATSVGIHEITRLEFLYTTSYWWYL